MAKRMPLSGALKEDAKPQQKPSEASVHGWLTMVTIGLTWFNHVTIGLNIGLIIGLTIALTMGLTIALTMGLTIGFTIKHRFNHMV